MKLTLLQFIAFAFMLGWVGTDVVGGATYQERLEISIFLAMIAAYLNNAHGIIWGKIKKGLENRRKVL